MFLKYKRKKKNLKKYFVLYFFTFFHFNKFIKKSSSTRKDKILNLYHWKTNKIVCESEKKRSMSRTEKEPKYNLIKNIKKVFKLKRENKAIKGKIILILETFLELENEDYYKPIRAANFHSNNYIE